jgi:hypothetical protein
MKRTVVFCFGGLVLLGLLVPTRDNVTPEWDVFVSDMSGTPIPGADVAVSSQQYTLEHNDTQESKATDENGHVHFKRRTIWAPFLFRFVGVVGNIASQGPHASFGVHTNIHANKKGYGDPSKLDLFGQNEREERANGPATQTSHIVLMKCAAGYSGFGCGFPDDPSLPPLPLQR